MSREAPGHLTTIARGVPSVAEASAAALARAKTRLAIFSTIGEQFVQLKDHLALGLATEDAEGKRAISVLVEVHDVQLSPGGAGFIVFLDVRAGVAPSLLGRRVFTDAPAVVDNYYDRVRAQGLQDAVPPLEALPATVERGRITDRLAVRMAADGIDLQLEWTDLSAPIWTTAPTIRTPAEQAWALVQEAASGRVEINGTRLPGTPFQDEDWLPWFGRTGSSAMVSLCEVHTIGSKVRRMR
jgi:hypothetical protein